MLYSSFVSFLTAFFIFCAQIAPALAASDEYQRRYRESADFRAAEDALNGAWKKLRPILDKASFQRLLANQREWLKKQNALLEEARATNDLVPYLREACERVLKLRAYAATLGKTPDFAGALIVLSENGDNIDLGLRREQKIGDGSCAFVYALTPPLNKSRLSDRGVAFLADARAGREADFRGKLDFYQDQLATDGWQEFYAPAKSETPTARAGSGEPEEAARAATEIEPAKEPSGAEKQHPSKIQDNSPAPEPKENLASDADENNSAGESATKDARDQRERLPQPAPAGKTNDESVVKLEAKKGGKSEQTPEPAAKEKPGADKSSASKDARSTDKADAAEQNPKFRAKTTERKNGEKKKGDGRLGGEDKNRIAPTRDWNPADLADLVLKTKTVASGYREYFVETRDKTCLIEGYELDGGAALSSEERAAEGKYKFKPRRANPGRGVYLFSLPTDETPVEIKVFANGSEKIWRLEQKSPARP